LNEIKKGGNRIEYYFNTSPYTVEEKVNEIVTTMSMAGMKLSGEEQDMLRLYESGKVSGDALRQKIIKETQRK